MRVSATRTGGRGLPFPFPFPPTPRDCAGTGTGTRPLSGRIAGQAVAGPGRPLDAPLADQLVGKVRVRTRTRSTPGRKRATLPCLR